MANLADIIAGAVSGSQSVQIRLNQADGAVVVVYRGNVLLGTATVENGLADVKLSLPLVAGDVVQASVTERGNQAGLPITAIISSLRVTGWKTPTEIEVVAENGDVLLYPADEFFRVFGYLPTSIYDPSGSRAVVYPEYEPQPLGSIQFSLLIRQVPGQTFVFIQNVTGQKGTPVVQWATGEAFGSDLSRVFTANQTLNVAVRGSDDATVSTRTVAIEVLASSVTPTAGDIGGIVYRFQNGPFIRVVANAVKQLEARLLGVNDWQQFNFEEANYQECFFSGLASGPYTIQVRVAGDTNTANLRSLTITKP